MSALLHAQQEFKMESNFLKSIKRPFTKDRLPVLDKSKLCIAGIMPLALKYLPSPGVHLKGEIRTNLC